MLGEFGSFAPTSSGDLLLDRRYRWATASLAEGDARTAEELLRSVTEGARDWAPGWFALGEACETLGDRKSAISAYEKVRACDPADPMGAGLRLARLHGRASDGAAAPAYIRALFDGYAASFDAHLTQRLAYRGPEALYAAVAQVRTERGCEPGFACVFDLGCGTGLAARAFAPVCGQIFGVDLSPGMIAEARRTRLYESLDVGDLLDFLARRREEEADLVLAADVFVYLGSLAPSFRAVRRVLVPGGLFALTLQRGDGDASLGADLRYSYSRAAVEGAAAGAQLAVAHLDPMSTRREKGVEAPGWVAVLERA